MRPPIDYLNERRESRPASGGRNYVTWRNPVDDRERERWEELGVIVCSGCGARADAPCDCGEEYIAASRESARQRSRAYRERKREAKQQPRHVTPDVTPDAVGLVVALVRNMTGQQRRELFRRLEGEYGAAVAA